MAQLERLHAAFHEVRRRCPLLPVLGIQWMSIKPPLHPVQEELLKTCRTLQQGSTRSRLWTMIPRRVITTLWTALLLLEDGLRVLGYALYLGGALVWLRWCLRHEMAILKRQAFVLVGKTWCFGTQRLPEGDDFYYGDLQERLARRGVRMLLLCGEGSLISLRPQQWRAFANAQMSTSDAARLPELALLHPATPWRVAVGQFLAAVRVAWMSAGASDPVVRAVGWRAVRGCLARQTMRNGLSCWIGRAAVRQWRPHAYVALYEGHSWEQCLWRGVKTADPSCRTVGYQHTGLKPSNLALLQPRDAADRGWQPDVVCCLGPWAQARLTPAHPGSRLISFGSFRYPPSDGAALGGPRPARRAVLVVPEGLWSEAKRLFELAMRIAPSLPDHRFIFRCHPAFPFAQVRPTLAWGPERFPNVEISSSEALEPDLKRSSVVLYRGSAVVLYALLEGLKPIYVQDEEEPDGLDPLFALRTWREAVPSAEAVQQALQRYASMSEPDAADQWRQATESVHGYTTPVTEHSIDQLLSAIGVTDA
ncbi:MAG: hypothetical protein HYZ91_01120 [Candidatus Omnitrophica bacterium]|nr:hypothetical protein [Candidatus Omnitrophota bacterium]